MPKNPIGMMIFIFIGFYYIGIVGVIKEKKIGRYKLHRILKGVLFVGSKHKNTINTIIYQSGILINFVISLSLFLFEVYDKEMIYKRYMLCTVILFLFEATFIGKLHIKEEMKRKKR